MHQFRPRSKERGYIGKIGVVWRVVFGVVTQQPGQVLTKPLARAPGAAGALQNFSQPSVQTAGLPPGFLCERQPPSLPNMSKRGTQQHHVYACVYVGLKQ